MMPEAFRITRERKEGGLLIGIYHHSMSLRNAVRHGHMPPLEIFNQFMACGYDDVDGGIDYIPEGPFSGAVLDWEPFSLSAQEYNQLLAYIREQGGAISIESFNASTFGEWFSKCHEHRSG